jgi:hypothetical protein
LKIIKNYSIFFKFSSFILLISYITNAQNGIIDLSFGTNGTVITTAGGEVFDMIIQPDDKFVLVGSNGSGAYDMTIMRFNADGSTDNSFGTNGKVTVDFNGGNDNALCVALQSDGKNFGWWFLSTITKQ